MRFNQKYQDHHGQAQHIDNTAAKNVNNTNIRPDSQMSNYHYNTQQYNNQAYDQDKNEVFDDGWQLSANY